jgi:putative ABC transport system permease protein
MLSFFHDLKITVRQLRKSLGFSITAVLMLALGIGATTAIFSIVEGVLLRPLPFPKPNRLMVISDILPGVNILGNGESGATAPDVLAYTRNTHSFTSVGGYANTTYELSWAGESAIVHAARMTGGVFPALAVNPLMGRVFTQEEDDQKQQVAVLSYTTWMSRFNGDPRVLGAKIELDRKPYAVIGVMPRNFEFPLVPGHLNRDELWVPMSFRTSELTTGASSWNFQTVARLKPGVTPAQALSDASLVAKEIVRNWPAYLAGFSMHPVVRPLQEETVEAARPLVRTLFLAVVVVLLIACANLAGLLLVRAIRRRREIAVRLALGTTGKKLLWHAMLDSLMLSVSGALLGLLLANGLLRVGVSLLPETLPRVREIGVDWSVIGFALALAVLTGLVCGLAPAFAAIRTNVNETLKEGGRGGSAGGHARLRSALVVAEIAVAMVLLSASGLLLRSFEKMRQVDMGFRVDHTLMAAYALPRQQYATQTAVNAFNRELERRLQQLPGVRSMGLTSSIPATGSTSNSGYVAEGRIPAKSEPVHLASVINIEGDYFPAIGIPLLHGRVLNEDDKEESRLVVVVNKTLAEQNWPGQDPIGKRLGIGVEAAKTPWAVVVGEVGDYKEGSPDTESKPQYYVANDQMRTFMGTFAPEGGVNGNGGYIVLRTAMEPEQMHAALIATVHAIDPQLPLTQVQTMERAVSDSEAPRRFNTALISSFALAAMLLAVLGIYSVIAFSVALRVQEMAIRMALGAQRVGIVRLVLTSGAKLAVLGCVIGLVGAAASARLLRSFLFGVSAADPLVLTLAAVAVLLLALAASLLPARRAASVDLARTLRSE